MAFFANTCSVSRQKDVTLIEILYGRKYTGVLSSQKTKVCLCEYAQKVNYYQTVIYEKIEMNHSKKRKKFLVFTFEFVS